MCGTTFLLTSDTAVLSHSSKCLLKTFLFTSAYTLSYSKPFQKHWMMYLIFNSFAADVFTGLGEIEGLSEGLRDFVCVCVCVCVCTCVRACV